MAAGRLYMTRIVKRLKMAGDSKNTSSIPSHLHFYVQLKFVDLKILSWFICCLCINDKFCSQLFIFCICYFFYYRFKIINNFHSYSRNVISHFELFRNFEILLTLNFSITDLQAALIMLDRFGQSYARKPFQHAQKNKVKYLLQNIPGQMLLFF